MFCYHKFIVAGKTESRNPNCVGRAYVPVMSNLFFFSILTKILWKEFRFYRSSAPSVTLPSRSYFNDRNND